MMIYQFVAWYLLGMASMLALIHVSSWTYIRFSDATPSRLKSWAQNKHDVIQSLIAKGKHGTEHR